MQLLWAQGSQQAWQQGLKPWLSGERFFGNVTLVLPHMGVAQELKAQWAQEGSAFLGIRIWTPALLRRALLAHADKKTVALREDLHLLMQVAALGSKSPYAALAAKGPAPWVTLYDSRQACALEEDAEGLLQDFQRCIDGSGLTTVQQQDRELCVPTPGTQDFLFYGFSAWDCSLWPLLQAGLRAARRAYVCLWATGALNWDALWLEQWETFMGQEAVWLDEEAQGPYAQSVLGLGAAVPLMGLETPHAECEAQAIVNQVGHWLGDAASTRIGLIFPTGSPVAARVSHLLEAQGIAHHDGIGLPCAQTPSYALLESYLAWQKDPRWTLFEPFLEKLWLEGFLESLEQLESIKQRLDKHFIRVLHETTSPDASPIEDLLQDWPLLPELAPLAVFWQRVQPLLARLDYILETPWVASSPLVASRLAFAQWLQGFLKLPGRVSGPSELLAPVQLLPWHAALGNSFSHVLIAQASAEAWQVPRLSLLDALERPQKADAVLAITPEATQAIQQATLTQLMLTAQKDLVISFCTQDSQGNLLNPLFEPLVTHRVVGVPLSPASDKDKNPPKQPENRFAFCSGKPLVLSAKEWEALFQYPEDLWFTKLLKAPPRVPKEEQDLGSLAVGIGVHKLLAAALAHGRIEPTSVQTRLERALQALKASVASDLSRLYATHIESKARALVAALLEHREGFFAATELSLRPGTQVALPGFPETLIPLSGRIDLLLSDAPIPPELSVLDASRLFEVVDFKTGLQPPLTLSGLERSIGLQVALYGLALRSYGASEVALTVLSPFAPWPSPFLLKEALALPLWAEMIERYNEGYVGGSV